MSMPIQRQQEQYEAFTGDTAIRAVREPVATVYVDHDVHDYLAGPSIHAGLNNTRAAAYDAVPGFHDRTPPSLSDLYEHEPRHIDPDDFQREFPHGEPPPGPPEGGMPVQPLDDMLEHVYRPDPRSSFSAARREGGPIKQAAPVPPAQPPAPAPPVWLGHAYVPGNRVGLPWRGQHIPGTVTHLEGTDVGVRWDDGQHSVEEPGGIRPL